MKFKLFAILLALSLVAWAQENPAGSNPNSTPKAETKSCCHHAEGSMSCGSHAAAEGKESMACCGKDSGCCAKNVDKDQAKCEKAGEFCCGRKDMKACAETCKKGGGCSDCKCCGGASEKSAVNCCGGACEKKAS